MRGKHSRRYEITRRELFRYSVAFTGGAISRHADAKTYESANHKVADQSVHHSAHAPPEFLVVREEDELFLRMRAVGFRVRPGHQRLDPVPGAHDHLLIFEIPPQQFSERALPVTNMPEVLEEADLTSITLSPASPGRLVFRVPSRPLTLCLESLLDWVSFEAIFPDVESAAPYDLLIPLDPQKPTSRVEMLWGIELAPADKSQKLVFAGSTRPRRERGWTELWSSALQLAGPQGQSAPISMEVFSVCGFIREGTTGSVASGDLVVSYKSDRANSLLEISPPIENWERVEFAVSLSRRFPYTGEVDPLRYTAKVRLIDEGLTFNAGYAAGRALKIDQYRIAARGGYLALRGQWAPYPGSALSGLTASTTGGRYDHVEIIREGFLFPFGTRCELLTLTERVFVKDHGGYYNAPLIKQVFLRVPQPNHIAVGHVESPFVSISVITGQTPPLDLPPSGNPSDYGKYDFFLPTVNGAPFPFQHEGTDWGGDAHRASMPLIFVSNAALAPNGLIWEPGYSWPPNTAGAPPASPYTIPRGGDGLRVVDKLWALQPDRIAQYGGTTMSLAGAQSKGQAAQKVEWIEWTRGHVPDLDPKALVAAPFRPRARTLRLRLQAAEHLSNEPSAILATYRDVRFTDAPFIDPEPTTQTDVYFLNVTAGSADPDVPYVYALETRALATVASTPTPRSPDQIAADIRDLYFRVSAPANAPTTQLFAMINNEVRFGASQSAEGVGGLAVPDTHVSSLNRRLGLMGDATFNERRWSGLSAVRPKLALAHRLDFAEFARTQRAPLDQTPFDKTISVADRDAAVAAARGVMGYPAIPPALVAGLRLGNPFAPELKLGDLFGIDAELVPGMRFADLFADVPLAGAPGGGSSALAATGSQPVAAEPLAWTVKLTGVEWLTELQTLANGAALLPQVLAAMVAEARPNPSGRPLSLGVEASLKWSNAVFRKVDIGPAAFIPKEGSTVIEIDAAARVDLGTAFIELDPPRLSFAAGKSSVTSSAELHDFAVEVFSAIRLNFISIAFDIAADGSKRFSPKLGSVDLLPPLDFINQIQSMFGGLGDGLHIRIEISPEQARISQTLAFPTSGEPLFMGPAQVTNLTLSWAVTVPLVGRDVLSAAFAIASREKPLTIYVPPWYGGKAYLLLEVTTRGCRLVEFSMEYGALVPITWRIATGQASLTAGIFYLLERDDAHQSAKVLLTGFVKASADLSIAGFIQFNGIIYISLTYKVSGTERLIHGEAGISVSIKVGFVRVSYAFTATHDERQSGGQTASSALSVETTTVSRLIHRSRPLAPRKVISALAPYGRSFSAERRAAFQRLIGGYASDRRSAQ